jgi:HK97 family phage portal protein
VVALTPINDPAVTRLRDGSLRYRWTENGRGYEEPQENVFHVRGFGGDPRAGLSTLSAGRQVFGLSTATNTAAQTTFANGMRPSGVLTVPTVLKAEQREPLQKALGDQFAGSVNAGRPMVLEAGVTWQQLTINPEDAQMLESRAFSVEEVARLFGVPPHMIGHTEKSTSWGTGLEQQTLGFVQFTLRKRLKRIEQAIEKQLLTPADRAAGVTVEFNLEGLLRGDSKGRAEFFQAALGDTQKPGWMVRNEVRKLENLPPVPGWDEPIALFQQTPPATPATAP